MAKAAPHPIPEGMHTLTPHFWFNGNAQEAVAFYQKAFGAVSMGPIIPTPDGKGVLHAMLKIGNSPIMLADAWPGTKEAGPQSHTTLSMWVYVEDCDAVFDLAIAAGCEVVNPMEDMFWGDRTGKLIDPFGHVWAIASHRWEFTPEEVAQGQKEWVDSLSKP